MAILYSIKKIWKRIPRYAIRLSVFLIVSLIVPIFLAFLLFWYNVELPVETTKVDDGRVKYTVNTEKSKEPSVKNTFRKIFQSPLDLSYYSICFKNKSFATQLDTKEIIQNPIQLILKNKDGVSLKELFIKGGEEGCHFFKGTDNTLFFELTSFGPWVRVEDIMKGKFNFEFVSNFEPSKAKPIRAEQYASSIIFLIAWLGILLLANSVHELYKKFVSVKNS